MQCTGRREDKTREVGERREKEEEKTKNEQVLCIFRYSTVKVYFGFFETKLERTRLGPLPRLRELGLGLFARVTPDLAYQVESYIH